MDNNLIKYSIDLQIIYSGQTVAANCNEILFINLGTNVANIDIVPLATGQQFSINGNVGEYCISQFNIQFTDTGGSNKLLVIRKNYV